MKCIYLINLYYVKTSSKFGVFRTILTNDTLRTTTKTLEKSKVLSIKVFLFRDKEFVMFQYLQWIAKRESKY